MLGELNFHPLPQFFHHRVVVLLVEKQPLLRR
jgi:hypothetical protein